MDINSVLDELAKQILEARAQGGTLGYREEGDNALADAGVCIAQGAFDEARNCLWKDRTAYASAKSDSILFFFCCWFAFGRSPLMRYECCGRS